MFYTETLLIVRAALTHVLLHLWKRCYLHKDRMFKQENSRVLNILEMIIEFLVASMPHVVFYPQEDLILLQVSKLCFHGAQLGKAFPSTLVQ